MSELTPYVANFRDQSLDVWRLLVHIDWQEGVSNLPFHALDPVSNTVPAGTKCNTLAQAPGFAEQWRHATGL